MLPSLPQLLLSNTLLASILAICAVLCARYYRKPVVAHGLWLLVFLKMITPPLLTPMFPVEIPAAPATAEFSQPVTSPVAQSLPTSLPQSEPISAAAIVAQDIPSQVPTRSVQPPLDTMTILYWIWAAGTVGWFVLLAWRTLRFHRTTRHVNLAPQRLQQQVRELAEQFGITNPPEIRIIQARVSPLLWRVGGQPLILLPADLLEKLSSAQISTVIAHELAHLQRRDHWARRLMLLVTGVYWWHPVVWWARRGLLHAEEQCCDAQVVTALPQHSRDYAAALLQTIDFLTGAHPPLPASATAFGQGKILKRRFEMILDKGVSAKLSWKIRSLMWVMGLAVLAVSPFVVAEEATDPPKPKVVGGSTKAYVKNPTVMEKRQTTKIAGKEIYEISCRLIELSEPGKEKTLFAPKIMQREGENGSINIGSEKPVMVPEVESTTTVDTVTTGCSVNLKVHRLKDDFVLLNAQIEYTPGISSGKLRDDDGLVAREYTHVFTQKIRVVEKVRLGGTFSVPFGSSDDPDSIKRRIEFVIKRGQKPKPKSTDQADLSMAVPHTDAPTKEQIRKLLLDMFKKRNNDSPFVKVTNIKNLRVTVEQTIDRTEPEKFYPLSWSG